MLASSSCLASVSTRRKKTKTTMSYLKGIADAKASRDSVYFRPGKYLAHLDMLKTFKNRKGAERLAFECTIVSVLDDTKSSKSPGGAHSVGEKASWVPGDQDAEFPRVKAAIKALTGCDESEIKEEFLQQLTSAAQPAQGKFFEIDVDMVPTKAGGLFTTHRIVRCWTKADVESRVKPELLQSLGLNTDLA